MDYRFDTLDLTDDSDVTRQRHRAWMQAVMHGFLEGTVEEELQKIWLTQAAADQIVCRGAWLPDDAYGAGPSPVATLSWFDKTLNVGRELLPLRMVTDVTTSPAHRRRGLVRRLVEDCLDDAVAQGLPLAALTVSEATIYGRWGFGAATFSREVELVTGPRFGLRDFTDPGRVELALPADLWPAISERLDRFHRRSRGSVGTPQFYEAYFTGAWSFQDSGPDKKLRAAVHLTADEEVDGVALWRPDGREDGKRKVKVMLHLADNPTAALALWQLLGTIDLVHKVTYGDLPPADPLPWALRDMNALKVVNHYEVLWVRVLDLPRAFAARPWGEDGEVVLGVDDAQGHVTGHYAITTRDGVAEVSPTDHDAEVTVDAETLGSLSLGGVDVTTLAAAGRVDGSPDAVARFAAMADLPDEPFNILGF